MENPLLNKLENQRTEMNKSKIRTEMKFEETQGPFGYN